MSLLIRGMEMPQICFKCKLSRIIPSIYIFCPLNEKCYPADEMPSDCPLVPVPPHGRCVDADALMKRMWEETDCMISVPATFVRDAPTIIPAEEGE